MTRRLFAPLAVLLLGSSACGVSAQVVPDAQLSPADQSGVNWILRTGSTQETPKAEELPTPKETPATSATEASSNGTFLSAIVFGDSCQGVVAAEAEYLLWFLQSSLGSVPLSTLDNLGQNVGLKGGDLIAKDGPISGGRFTLGYWRVRDNPWVPGGINDWGLESRSFFVGQRSIDSTIDQPATLVRPFFNLNNRTSSGVLVGTPGIATGSIHGRADAEVWGTELNFWKTVFYNTPGTWHSIRLMAGLRYMNADSSIDVNATSSFDPAIPAASPYASFAGNRLQVLDSFSTRNQFFGAQVGVGMSLWIDCFCVEGVLKVAVGNTNQELSIRGSQLRTLANGAQVPSTGGLLALPSNIGEHRINKFTQIPEAELKIKYQVNRFLTLSTGFNAIYWNRILRAANQIDRTIDITQIPNYPLNNGVAPTGLNRPAVFNNQSDLWLLGLSVGAEVRW